MRSISCRGDAPIACLFIEYSAFGDNPINSITIEDGEIEIDYNAFYHKRAQRIQDGLSLLVISSPSSGQPETDDADFVYVINQHDGMAGT